MINHLTDAASKPIEILTFTAYNENSLDEFVILKTPYKLNIQSNYILRFNNDVSVSIQFIPHITKAFYTIVTTAYSDEQRSTYISIHYADTELTINPISKYIDYTKHSCNSAAITHDNIFYSTAAREYFLHHKYFIKQKFKSIVL